MEPRPHERGNFRFGLHVRERAVASMEPRPHERGNYDVVNNSGQWFLQAVCERKRRLKLKINLLV